MSSGRRSTRKQESISMAIVGGGGQVFAGSGLTRREGR